MNGQVEATWRTLRTVAHSLMVHARVPELYVHFALLLMHILRFQNFMVWIISQQKKLWTNWICSSPDSGKLNNLDGGI